MADEPEYTEGGQPVYRHKPREKGFEFAHGDTGTIRAVEEHLARHAAAPDNVFHEIVSDLVHLDVHCVRPGDGRPFTTLMTSGMSDRPMTVPDGFDGDRFAELCLFLPPDWPLSEKAFEREKHYWPVRWLKQMARLPHEYDTWLGFGHTVPNGDPATEVADGAGFIGLMLGSPASLGEGFGRFDTPDGRAVSVYSLVPLYQEEMDLKLRDGAEAVLERFDEFGITDVLRVGRPNVAAPPRRKWLGLF